MKKRKRRTLKSEYQLYKIARKYAGQKLKTKEVDKIFGYSPRCKKIDRRRILFKFIAKSEYKHPSQYWVIADEVALKYEELPEWWIDGRVTKVKGGKAGFSKSGGYVMNGNLRTIRFRNQILFLVPPNVVPFWKLKQYGGWL